MDRYEPGTAVRIWDRVRDVTGALANADSVEVQILFGTTVVQAFTAMSSDDTGIYYYDWQSATDDEEGRYSVITKATNGDKVSRRRAKDLFELCDQT